MKSSVKYEEIINMTKTDRFQCAKNAIPDHVVKTSASSIVHAPAMHSSMERPLTYCGTTPRKGGLVAKTFAQAPPGFFKLCQEDLCQARFDAMDYQKD